MSVLTFDRSHTVPSAHSAIRRKSRWRSFLDAMVASRMRHAEREIVRRGYLLPRELDRMESKASTRSEDSLPFVR